MAGYTCKMVTSISTQSKTTLRKQPLIINNYAFVKRHKSNVNALLMGATGPQETYFLAKVFLKKVGLSCDFNVSIVIIDLIDWGTAFHKVGAATLKDRGPWVFRLVGGISSRFALADLRVRAGE